MYMLAVVKEIQPFGVLLSSECRPQLVNMYNTWQTLMVNIYIGNCSSEL